MNEATALLVETSERVLSDHCSDSLAESVEAGERPDALWSALTGAGLPKAAMPEPDGSGFARSEAVRFVRAAGFHAAPAPAIETTLCGWALGAVGLEMGDGLVAAALDRPHAPLAIEADGGSVTGTLRAVPWAPVADEIVAWAERAGTTCLVRLNRIENATPNSQAPGGVPAGTVALDAYLVPSGDLAVADGRLDRDLVLAWGAVLTSAAMVGAMERALGLAVGYAGERVQFGRPIGKFQAVQHMLADAAGHLAAAGAATDMAAEWLDRDDRDALLFVAAAAKARTGEAAGRVAAIVHQVHGAIGFSREHSLNHLTRRLWVWRDQYGSERFWQELLGRTVAAGGADELWPTLARF